MEGRRILSYALFSIGLVLFIAVGALASEWLIGLLLGLVFIMAGAVFYRRGK